MMTLGEAQIAAGSQGSDVKRLQEILSGGGYNVGPIDGVFGPQTLAAVKSFQLTKGLLADGVVGPQTWAALMVPPIQERREAPPAPAPSMFNTQTLLVVGLAVLSFFAVARKR